MAGEPQQEEMSQLWMQIHRLATTVDRLASRMDEPQADWMDEVFFPPHPGGGGASGSVTGNQEGSVRVSGDLKVRSADDSNVRVLTRLPDGEESEESCDGVIEIGVYYV